VLSESTTFQKRRENTARSACLSRCNLLFPIVRWLLITCSSPPCYFRTVSFSQTSEIQSQGSRGDANPLYVATRNLLHLAALPVKRAETPAGPFRAAIPLVSSFLGSPLGVPLSGSERCGTCTLPLGRRRKRKLVIWTVIHRVRAALADQTATLLTALPQPHRGGCCVLVRDRLRKVPFTLYT
jgi:hypothetical protein